jgi:hypothetical protein
MTKCFGTRHLLLPTLLLCCASAAHAHDLITAESAERYLAEAQQRLDVLRSRQPVAQRAEAATRLGRMLDEIRDLLNRDLEAHGRVQGLLTEYLVRELKTKGLSLEVSPILGRVPANVSWYREALRLSPEGPHAADASFRWLQGEFYDSFDADPLRPRRQNWAELQEQIALGERTLKLAPSHPDIEEAKFILAVLYTRAARIAPDRKTSEQYADRARAAIAEFQSRYPESLRVAALPILRQSLDRPRR